MHSGSHGLPGSEQQLCQNRTGRSREPYRRHEATPEEGADPPPRAIKELIRNDNIQRREVLAHAAHRRGGDYPLRAQELEPEDVRPEIQLGWHQTMAASVPREKRHPPPCQRPDDVGIRRRSEWGLDAPLLDPLESIYFVQPTAADDTD